MDFRAFLEEREAKLLAPYAISSRDAGKRAYGDGDQHSRTDFMRDRDRVVFCSAFKRLEYKTQVFPNHEGDHYRNRLTHTIEVANLSRTLAASLRLNEDFCECLALVHDIGHPPFGHCGETILARLMEGRGGFEHNEQSYRLVTVLERRYAAFKGLNLTERVLEAILQHTKNYRLRYPDAPGALLETRLVSLADEMVYNAHDMEDGLYSGVLQLEQLQEISLCRRLMERSDFPRSGEDHLKRRFLVRKLLNEMVMDFLNFSHRALTASPPENSMAGRQDGEKWIHFSAQMLEGKAELEAFLKNNMYRHPKVMKMMNKSKYFLERLFQHFLDFPEELPLDFRELMDSDGVERCVADYISGMTDRFFQEEYVRVFMPFQKML